jgi:hypothetical protein
MKLLHKYYMGLILLLLVGPVSGQTYTLSVETAPYQPLQGGTALVSDVWDDPVLNVSIGFPFEFFTETIQELATASGFSYISLAAPPVDDIFSLFIIYGTDLVDRGFLDSVLLSPISRKVTGSQGSRVFTIEFENAGFYGDLFTNGTSTDYVNFQMSLYEANGDIVFHFGPSVITMPELDFSGLSGPVMGLAQDYDAFNDAVNGETLLLSGDPSDPDVLTSYQNVNLDGAIPENTLYRFSRESTATVTPEDRKTEYFFSPNPTTGMLQVLPGLTEDITSPVDIYNNQGQYIGQSENASIDLRDLPAGIYQLRFSCGNQVHTERIVRLPD